MRFRARTRLEAHRVSRSLTPPRVGAILNRARRAQGVDTACITRNIGGFVLALLAALAASVDAHAKDKITTSVASTTA
jgi:hypothetical protein